MKHAFLNWDLKHEKECIINNFWIPLKQQPYFDINLIGLNWVFGMLESKLFSEFNRLHDLLGSASHCGRFSLLLSLRQWEGRETEGSPTVSFTEALKTSAWLADPFPCIYCSYTFCVLHLIRAQSQLRIQSVSSHLLLKQHKHSSRQWEDMLVTYHRLQNW